MLYPLRNINRGSPGIFFIFAGIILAAIFILAVFLISPVLSLAITVAAIFFIATFLKLEVGFAILIFSMLLSPEFNLVGALPGAFRGVTLRVDDLLLGVIFFAFLARMALMRSKISFKYSPLYLPLSVYMFIKIIATLWGINKGSVYPMTGMFFVLKEIEFLLIFFVVYNYVREQKQVKNFLIIFLIMTVIVGIYGFTQIGRVNRVAAPFDTGEANTFGGFLVLMYACILGILFYSESIKVKMGMITLAVLLFFPFLFTLSRSSYLGLVLTLLVFFLLTRNRGLLFILFFMLVLSPWWLPQEVISRITYTFSGYRGYTLGPSAISRLGMWRYTLRMWLESPLLGHGVTGVRLVDNYYVRLLGETGILGLGAFFWVISVIGRCAWKLYRESKDRFTHYFAVAYIAGFVGILAHAITTNTFYIVRIMEPFWFITALMMVLWEKEVGLTKR